MSKYGFLDDYSEGCHPNILEAIANTNSYVKCQLGLPVDAN
jgi:hypothetical protein